jgi:hypothetical protein
MRLARGWRIALRTFAFWWVIVGPLGLMWFMYYFPHRRVGLIGDAIVTGYVLFTGIGVVILRRLRTSN